MVWQVGNRNLHSIDLHHESIVLWIHLHITVEDHSEYINWSCFLHVVSQPDLDGRMEIDIALTCLQSLQRFDFVPVSGLSSPELQIWVLGCSPEPQPGSKSWASHFCISCCWMWPMCPGPLHTQLEQGERQTHVSYYLSVFVVSLKLVPSMFFTCMSLGNHVGDLLNPVVLVNFQLCCSVPNWQRKRKTHTKFVEGPL